MWINNKNIIKIETDKEMIQKSCIKISKLKIFQTQVFKKCKIK